MQAELEAVGKAIRKALPEGVRAGRIGGGEFVLQADFDTEEEMRPCADAVLERIRALTLPDGQGGTRNPSASIGVVRVFVMCVWIPGSPGPDGPAPAPPGRVS